MERKSNNTLVYLLLTAAVVLVLLSSFLLFSRQELLQVNEFDVEFQIVEEERTAVNINTSLLIFGKTYPGGSGLIRTINITNSYDFPIEVKVFVSENLAGFLKFDSSFFAEKDEQITVPVTLQASTDAEYGNYTGKIRLELYEFEG